MHRVGLLLGLLTGIASAQSLTMEQAVAKALELHPDLAAARAARSVVRLQAESAKSIPAPEFRMSINNLSLDPELVDVRNSLAGRWSPPRPREFSLKSRLAEAKRQTVEAEIRTAEARVAASVRDAYRHASLADERVALAEAAVSLRRQMIDVVRRQVASGLKERVEVDLAELALADAQIGLQRVASGAAVEHRRLTRLIDPLRTRRFALVPVPAPLPPVGSQELMDRALRSRPELEQAAGVCRQAEASLALAGNGRYPWLSFIQVTRRLGAASAQRGPWGIQAGIDLPLFRSAAAAERNVSAAVLSRCRLEEQAFRARIRHEVEDAAAQFESALIELKGLEQILQGPAARAVSGAKTALAAGRADLLDVLQAELRQLSLRDRWLERRQAVAALETNLEAAAPAN